MTEWLATYPYLAVAAALLGCFGLFFFLPAAPRRLMLLSGLFSTFSASYALVFVPQYWNPSRILDASIGIEDVVFSFANGGITWFLAAGGRAFRGDLEVGRVVSRFLWCIAVVAVVSVAGWRAGLPVMTYVLLAAAAVSLLVAPRQRHFLPLALRSAAVFALLYTTMACLALEIWPHWAAAWSPDVRLGARLFHLPVEEVYWAIAYGLSWPLAMAHVFGHGHAAPAEAMRLNCAR